MLFLNDDAVVRPGAIDALAAYLDGHPDVAVAAPTLVRSDGARQVSCGRRRRARGRRAGGAAARARPACRARRERPQPVGWAMGCALLVRRDGARAAGGFDEGYFMYSEEVDLCVRLAAAGGATHWVPEAEVVHDGQGTTGDSPERAVEMARSRRRYQRRHYSPRGRLAARAGVVRAVRGAGACRARAPPAGAPVRAAGRRRVGASRARPACGSAPRRSTGPFPPHERRPQDDARRPARGHPRLAARPAAGRSAAGRCSPAATPRRCC